jgi:hypothetical protein
MSALETAGWRFGRRRFNREELSMPYMKTAMAIAAVCAAMVSLTMAAKRKRDGSKEQRSRG